MKKSIRSVLFLIFLFIFAFSAWQLWEIYSGYKEGKESYEKLEQYVSVAETEDISAPEVIPSTSTTPPAEDSTEATEPPDVSAWPLVDFAQLSEINSDIVGWIYIEGTNINYPIVQGSDNSYYLKRMFDGTYNAAGSIFMDYRCAEDFSDRHSIIYGHRMNNKTMFGRLTDYKKQAFYDEHSVALMVTPTAYYKIQFFSGYVSDNWSNAWELDLDETNYGSWLKEIQEKSCFDTSYAPTTEDRIITLSTCTYEFTNAKFLLHGYISEAIPKALLGE